MGLSDVKDTCAIVGLGTTKMGRVPGVSSRQFMAEAARLAVVDAGLRIEDVDGWIYQGGGYDDAAPRMLGAPANFFWAMQTGGATVGAMIATAVGAIQMGLATCIVCATGDNSQSGRRQIGGAGIGGEGSAEWGNFGMVGSHAFYATRHMAIYGTKPEHLGAIAVTERAYANSNPEATFFDRPLAMEDYLSSRFVVEPLRLVDCCLISDGGVAFIVTSAERARDLRKPPVYISGFGQGHQLNRLFQAKEQYTTLPIQTSKDKAFAMASVDLSAIDIAQLYDCFTITVLLQLEGYGFCGVGEGGPFVAAGNLRPDGAIPTNTGGGQLSAWYKEGFTPLAEAVVQLRGEGDERQIPNTEVALVSGHGGTITSVGCRSHATVVLRR